jgi:hypothetical protein
MGTPAAQNTPPRPNGDQDGEGLSVAAGAPERAKPHRLSPSSLSDMRRVSKRLNCVTTWLRAVHSGHGQDLWRSELENKGLVVVHAPSPAEGAYILIPTSTTAEDVVRALVHINLSVRRRTHFDEMNRANKSRVVFKCEPFTVAPTGDERPNLIRTTRFSQAGTQPAPSQRYQDACAATKPDTGGGSSTNSTNNGPTNGSLSLDALAQMAPMLDQKSRSDHIDMLSDLGF